jgi:hypothetical protein
VRLRLAEHASLTDRLGQLAVQVVHRPSHHG